MNAPDGSFVLSDTLSSVTKFETSGRVCRRCFFTAFRVNGFRHWQVFEMDIRAFERLMRRNILPRRSCLDMFIKC